MPSKFVHLHTHSHYSLLDGLIKIDDLVDEAVKLGMPAIALTDHGNMYGTVEFYKVCKKAGIKPIIGVETYIALESMLQKRLEHRQQKIPPDTSGKKRNWLQKSFENRHRQPPGRILLQTASGQRVSKKHSEGLIALSACTVPEKFPKWWKEKTR